MEEFFHRTRPSLASRPAAELEQAVHHASFDHHAAVPPEAVPLEAVPLAAPPQEAAPQATVLNKADPLVAVPHAVSPPFEAVPRTSVPSLSDRVEQPAVIPQPGEDDHVEPNPAAFSRPPVSLPRLTFLPAVPSSHAGAPLSLPAVPLAESPAAAARQPQQQPSQLSRQLPDVDEPVPLTFTSQPTRARQQIAASPPALSFADVVPVPTAAAPIAPAAAVPKAALQADTSSPPAPQREVPQLSPFTAFIRPAAPTEPSRPFDDISAQPQQPLAARVQTAPADTFAGRPAAPFTAFARQPAAPASNPAPTPTPQPIFAGVNAEGFQRRRLPADAATGSTFSLTPAAEAAENTRFPVDRPSVAAAPFQFTAAGFDTARGAPRPPAATAGRSSAAPFSVFSPAAFSAITIPSSSSTFGFPSAGFQSSSGVQLPGLRPGGPQSSSVQDFQPSGHQSTGVQPRGLSSDGLQSSFPSSVESAASLLSRSSGSSFLQVPDLFVYLIYLLFYLSKSKSQQPWVRYQHPATQWDLRGGR
jgi:hypothetical protein